LQTTVHACGFMIFWLQSEQVVICTTVCFCN